MRVLKIILFVLALVFVYSSSIQARTVASSSNKNAKSVTKKTIYEEDKDLLENIKLLRAQNTLIKGYQDDMLNTVYWSLAGVVTVALILSGFGWWTNTRSYETDKARLEEKLDIRISEQETNVALQFESARTDIQKDTETRVSESRAQMSSEIKELKSYIDLVANDLKETKEAIQKHNSDVSSFQSNVIKAISVTNSELRQVEERFWDLKGVPGNILITQTQGLDAAVLAENSYQIESVLKRMNDTIQEKFIDAQKNIDDTIISYINKSINKKGVGNEVIVADIKNKIKKATSFS